MNRDELLTFIKQAISEETDVPVGQIDDSQAFISMGLDSLSSIVILNKIEDKFNVELNPIYFWDYPTLGAFTDFLLEEHIRS
jgi:acyl carrier protein